MCTVTYIPTENQGFVLTSNRDELIQRPTKAPEIYKLNDVEIAFPKDLEKGGTWIASGNNGRTVCLLNGAFTLHQKRDFHTYSRGQVLLDVASYNGDLKDFIEKADLNATEPFTVIAIEQTKEGTPGMMEFIWDGKQKHLSEPDPKTPAIWSSATLYNNDDREMRKRWFERFLKEKKDQMTVENIYDFHSGTHTTDQTINLLMEREDGLKTVSITQVVTETKGLKMKYHDILEDEKYQIQVIY